jgi:hypothetical protein
MPPIRVSNCPPDDHDHLPELFVRVCRQRPSSLRSDATDMEAFADHNTGPTRPGSVRYRNFRQQISNPCQPACLQAR